MNPPAGARNFNPGGSRGRRHASVRRRQQQVAAIDGVVGAGDVRRGRRGEKDGQRHAVAGCPEPVGRDVVENPFGQGAAGGLPERILDHVPADRFGTPGDCVPLAVFLASTASAYVTGSYYPVDGGHLLLPSPY